MQEAGISKLDNTQEESADNIAHSVIRGIYNQVLRLENEQKDREWFLALQNNALFSRKLEKGLELVKALSMAQLKRCWDDLDSAVKKEFGFTWIEICLKWEPEWSSSTVYNYVDTVDTWLLTEQHAPSHLIPVPKTINGKQVYENGRAVVTYTEFDPLSISISKLVTAKATVKRGEMTDQLWAALVNPDITRDQLSSMIRANKEDKGVLKPIYFLEGSLLLVRMGYEEKIIAELNFDEYYDNDLVKSEIDRLLYFYGVEMDEDAIARLSSRVSLVEV